MPSLNIVYIVFDVKLMSKLENSNINTTSIVSGTSWLWTAIVWMPHVTQDTEDVIVTLIVCPVCLHRNGSSANVQSV